MLISLMMRAFGHQSGLSAQQFQSTKMNTNTASASALRRTATEHPEGSYGKYVLATGEAAAYRLGLLQRAYGAGTRQLLTDVGVNRGMHVADFGCGIGTVTAQLAELVGPEGEVVGLDMSADQLAQAKKRFDSESENVRFVEASAMNTRLPSATFDAVYCRFLLMHLVEPTAALAEMRRLLKPNGIIICEDGDLTSAGTEPTSALNTFAELFGKLGPVRGVDYTLGKRLYHLVTAAGFKSADVRFHQPVIARGAAKRLLELSVAEAGPAFVAAGFISAAELDRRLLDMRRLAEDDRVLAIMPRMTQVWARKVD
jgi:SAM-dependent methyltransferase